MISEPLPKNTPSRLAHISVLDVRTRVVSIFRAAHWRKFDERQGDGAARRMRIRMRKAKRASWTSTPNVEPKKPKHTVPKSHKGRAA